MNESKILVLGCRYSIEEMKYIRIESPLINIAFEPEQRVILYTTILKKTNDWNFLKKEKNLLKMLLGGFWDENTYGVYELSGDLFKTVLPVNPSNKSSLNKITEEEFKEDQEVLFGLSNRVVLHDLERGEF